MNTTHDLPRQPFGCAYWLAARPLNVRSIRSVRPERLSVEIGEMAWVRLDDHFDQHPKIAAVGPLGLALWVSGIAYCNRNLTDGFIPRNIAHGLMQFELDTGECAYSIDLGSAMSGEEATVTHVVTALIHVGLWDEVPGGYKIHDYLDYQPSKKDVLSARKSSADRVAAHRFRRRSSNADRNASGNAVTNADVTTAPVPDPDPYPPRGATAPPPHKAGTVQRPPGPPQYVVSCPTCAAMLNALNEATASTFNAPGRTGLWMHEAHAGRKRDDVLDIIVAQVARLNGDRTKRRFLSPSILFKPENWDTTVNQRAPKPFRIELDAETERILAEKAKTEQKL